MPRWWDLIRPPFGGSVVHSSELVRFSKIGVSRFLILFFLVYRTLKPAWILGWRGAILPFSGFILPFSGLFSLFPGGIHILLACSTGRVVLISLCVQQGRKTETMAELTNHKTDNYTPEAHEAGSRWVTMSNALTRAGHGLSLGEKRLMAIAISKLDSRKGVRPGEALSTRVSAAEYSEAYDVDINTAYEQLKEAGKHLYNRSITFYEPAFKRNGKPIKPTLVNMRWVGQADYQEGEGWIELHWWHAVLRHLVGLSKQFTSYQLQQTMAFRSAHSYKLLELLMRFKSTGWAEYSIEDFATSMDATEKQKADFAKIRTKIIEPAIKDLTEKDGWLIQWRPIKAGRKVKALRFDFMRNPQQRLDLEGE